MLNNYGRNILIYKDKDFWRHYGRKNGKTGLKVLAPLYVHNEDGSYTDEVLKLFGKC